MELNKEYQILMKELSEEVKEKREVVERLKRKVEELEYIVSKNTESEEKLMLDCEKWRSQYLSYKNECDHLNKTLKACRESELKYRGEASILRAALKYYL